MDRLTFREAELHDISEMSRIRLAVLENRLSDPSRVKTTDYTNYLTLQGKGWVAEWDEQIIGFAIVFTILS